MAAIKSALSGIGALVLCACLGLAVDVRPAVAHRVNVFAWVDGETVHTESKFSGGKTVNKGQVVVTDLDGNRLLEGQTDENGLFSFTIPQRTGMRIELIAGMGHRGEWLLSADELGGAGPSPGPDESRHDGNASGAGNRGKTAAVGIDAEQLEQVVEAALDRKLQPIRKMLAEDRRTGPTAGDIFGGIGYILGLVGLATYVRFRKQRKDTSGS
jgi:nickel transport protein